MESCSQKRAIHFKIKIVLLIKFPIACSSVLNSYITKVRKGIQKQGAFKPIHNGQERSEKSCHEKQLTVLGDSTYELFS